MYVGGLKIRFGRAARPKQIKGCERGWDGGVLDPVKRRSAQTIWARMSVCE